MNPFKLHIVGLFVQFVISNPTSTLSWSREHRDFRPPFIVKSIEDRILHVSITEYKKKCTILLACDDFAFYIIKKKLFT